MSRLRNLSQNGHHLTLDLAPVLSLPSTSVSPSPSTSSSPTMGRFTVTTCQPDVVPNNRVVLSKSPPQGPPPEPEPPQPPQPKDERLLTPLERLQIYVDNPNMHCRNGVAVQYVNFIKDAEDAEQFIAQSVRLFERLVQVWL